MLFSEDVSERAAEVLLDGDSVQRCECVVHPHITEVRVHESQAHGRRSEHGVDDREGVLRVMARGFCFAEKPGVVD